MNASVAALPPSRSCTSSIAHGPWPLRGGSWETWMRRRMWSRTCSRGWLASPRASTGRAAWTTWLHRVMVNSSINWLRARKRREKLSHEPQEPASPEAHAVGEEMQRHFGDALKQVSDLQRQVLWLREVRGFSYPEIAHVLHIPEGTVKSSLHRGRVRALEVLEERGQRP